MAVFGISGSFFVGVLVMRGPKDHINITISHSGSRGQYEGDTRNHGWQDPCVYVVFWGPNNKSPTRFWQLKVCM